MEGEYVESERRVRHEGFDIYGRVFQGGKGEGTLVAIAGITSHGGTFRNSIPYFLEVYRNVLTPDAPGNGRSTGPHDASVQERAEAILKFVEGYDVVAIQANSGHAAIGIELQERLTEKGQDPVLILSGPVYRIEDTFLGRAGKPVLYLARIPGVLKAVRWIYSRFVAQKNEKKIRNHVKLDPKAIYHDVLAAEKYFQEKDPLLKYPEKVTVLRFEKDPLCRLSLEELEELHRGATVIDTGYRGHHIQRGAPERLVEYHRKALRSRAGGERSRYSC